MKTLQQKFSVFLCFLLMFISVFTAAPIKVQASDVVYTISQTMAPYGAQVVIYKGASDFYVGDLFHVYKEIIGKLLHGRTTEDLGPASLLSGVGYKSSNKSVATVHKTTGLLTTKKTGTTTITLTYKNRTASIPITVLSKKKFYKGLSRDSSVMADYYKDVAAKADKEAAAFLKLTGKKPSLKGSNRYECLAAYDMWGSKQGNEWIRGYNAAGKYESVIYFYSPASAHAYAVNERIYNYFERVNPFFTFKSFYDDVEYFKLQSISGKGKKINVTLKSKVTEETILGAMFQFRANSKIKKTNTYTFPIVVEDTSNHKMYDATASIKKGSKKMTIQLKKHQLKKGRTYKLHHSKKYSPNFNWLDDGINKNRFKAK